VGRTELILVDSSRTEPFSQSPDARRELAVWVWYPAEAAKASRRAEYVPHLREIAGALGDSLVHAEFGSADSAIASGLVLSHSIADAPLLKTHRPFPVLIFSHGFGETSVTYSAQLEDLASHGYVVFGIDHPFDAWAVWLAPGRVVPFAGARWDSALARPGGAVAYQLAQVPLRADDIRFLLGQVIRLNRGVPGSRFAGALDVGKIGAFGHSLGGIAAASACRRDARIRACLNEDADDAGRPYDGGPEALPIKQPFLFFATGHSIYVSPRTPQPSDSQLAGMHLSRTQYDSIVTLYQHNQDAALQSLPGSIRVSAESEHFTHRTFLDLRVLQAPDSAALAEQQHYLGVIRRYVRAFFDQALRGKGESVLAGEGAVDSLITVTHFARLAQ
jgi:predicted dienelactone hydrolase